MALDEEGVQIASEAMLRQAGVLEEKLTLAMRAMAVPAGASLAEVKHEAYEVRKDMPFLFSTSGAQQRDGKPPASLQERGRAKAEQLGWRAPADPDKRTGETSVQRKGRENAIRLGWKKP